MSLKNDFKIAAYAIGGMVTVTGALLANAVIEADSPQTQSWKRASARNHRTELLDDSTETALALILGANAVAGATALLLAGRKDKSGPGPKR